MAALFIYLVIFHLDKESLPTSLIPPLVPHPPLLSGRLCFSLFSSAHNPHPTPSSLPYIKAVLFFRDQ